MLAAIIFLAHLYICVGRQWGIDRLAFDMGMLAAAIAFFSISGFSIAHSVTTQPEGFYSRRFWRIWPTYLASFAMTVFVTLYLQRVDPSQQTSPSMLLWLMIINLLMLQGFLAPVLGANAGTWTLAVQEWLYLLAPIFRRLPSLVLCIFIAASAVWYTFAANYGVHRFAIQNHGVSFAAFAWAWLCGFVFYFHNDQLWARLCLLLLPVLLICLANELGGLCAPATVVGTMYMIAFGGDFHPSLRSRRVLTYWGNLSYPIYLVHYPVFMLLRFGTTIRNPWPYVLIAGAVSYLVYRFIDAPNRHRHRSGDKITSSLLQRHGSQLAGTGSEIKG